MSTAHLARLRARLEREVEAGRLPGAVVAIARRGRLVFYEALGFLDPAARTPMRKDAIFSIASMTKPLTAVATLLLMEEGRLHLAEPAARYLPMLARARVVVDAANPAATVPLRVPISIHDLLRHTAGMTYAWEGSSATHKLWPGTPSQFARELDGTSFLEAVARWPLLHQPASVWEYGVATDVAGLLVEAVAGQPLGKFLGERLFTKLGMRDTSFVVPASAHHRYARFLAADPTSGRPLTVIDSTQPHRFDCGGACAVSTAADYLRFAQMLLDRGRLGTVRILSRKAVELMTSDHLGGDIPAPAVERDPTRRGQGHGLAVSVRTAPGIAPSTGSVGEFGWGGAWGTQFWVDPQEQLVVVFMAHTPGSLRQHHRQLLGSLVTRAIED